MLTRRSVVKDDPYLLANLTPRSTGLPMVVWVSERGRARHDVRVKVARRHGDNISSNFNDTASVAVRPQPHLVAGELSPADLQAVSQWITLNTDALVGYWNGELDTGDLLERLRRLPD